MLAPHDVLVERNEGIKTIALIMSSLEFSNFLEAEANLITFINTLAGDDEYLYSEMLTNLSRAANKFLTFKCIPWKSAEAK
jgi:hypothetical protein